MGFLGVFQQKLFDFAAPRRRRAAAEAGAFERGGRGGEAQRTNGIARLDKRERKSAVKDVTGRKRVDRIDREGRRYAAGVARPPMHWACPVGHREEGAVVRVEAAEARGEIVASGCRGEP